MIKAGLLKEWFYFWRNFRFGGVILLYAGCALMYPLAFALMNAVAPQMEEFGLVMHDDALMEIGLQTSFMMSLGLISGAVIFVLIIIMGAAGKEQTKRSIVMPQTAGLTIAGYVLPKFMLFPPVIFAVSVASMLVTGAACKVVFGVSYSVETTLLTGAIIGTYSMFLVCMYLFFGISFASPGMSVLYVLAADTAFGALITFGLKVDKYTPWNLIEMVNPIISGGKTDANDIIITVAITLTLSVIFMLLTLFVMTAKRLDNTSDVVY